MPFRVLHMILCVWGGLSPPPAGGYTNSSLPCMNSSDGFTCFCLMILSLVSIVCSYICAVKYLGDQWRSREFLFVQLSVLRYSAVQILATLASQNSNFASLTQGDCCDPYGLLYQVPVKCCELECFSRRWGGALAGLPSPCFLSLRVAVQWCLLSNDEKVSFHIFFQYVIV